MRVHFWAAEPDGCAYYRCLLPMAALNEAGVVQAHTTLDYCDGAEDADVLVGQRLLGDKMARWGEQVATGRALVYELDDDFWHLEPDNPATVHYPPAVLRAMEDNIAHSSAVTVSTAPLAEVVRAFNPNVHVVPNFIDRALLDVTVPRRGLTVGWAGSPTHRRDLAVCAKPVRKVLARRRLAQVHLVGTDYRRLLGQGRFSPWVPWVPNYYAGLDFDIGLAPLADTAFNASKCLDATTRVTTRRGVVAAGLLNEGDAVWHEGKWRTVQAVQKMLPTAGVEIEVKQGYRIRLTPEHRLMTKAGAWIRAADIRPGAVLLAEPEGFASQPEQEVPWPAQSRMSRAGFDPFAHLDAEDGPLVRITPRWGRILGAYIGDGSVGQSTTLTISCDGQDQDWIELLMADFRAIGLNPMTEAVTTYNGTVLRRRRVEIACAHLLRVLADLGLTEPRANGRPRRVVRVPEVIWRSPQAVVAEFIAGYFEADGHCTSSGVEAVSKSESLIRDLQRLLLRFGIQSRVRPRAHACQTGATGTYWHLVLGRDAADVFVREIGFRSERKRARLAAITARPHSNAFRPMQWEWEVVEVRPCPVEPVDLQCEGEVFAAAGFVSHNSRIKALEYAALGIPVIASPVGEYPEFVRHGETGFLAHTAEDWARYLRLLIDDPKLRARMGAAAREWAAEHTIQGNLQSWLTPLTSVLERVA